METSQESGSEKGWVFYCRGSISQADQEFQTAMRKLPPMVRLEAPRLHCARTGQAGNAADGRSRTTRNKSPRCMRAQQKGSSPSKPLAAERDCNYNRCKYQLLTRLLSGLRRTNKLHTADWLSVKSVWTT